MYVFMCVCAVEEWQAQRFPGLSMDTSMSHISAPQQGLLAKQNLTAYIFVCL